MTKALERDNEAIFWRLGQRSRDAINAHRLQAEGPRWKRREVWAALRYCLEYEDCLPVLVFVLLLFLLFLFFFLLAL